MLPPYEKSCLKRNNQLTFTDKLVTNLKGVFNFCIDFNNQNILG